MHIQKGGIYQFIKNLLFHGNILEKCLLLASRKVSTKVKKKKKKL